MDNLIDLSARRPEMPSARATYTVAEVARLLGLSRANTYALLGAGEIPARRLGTRWVIPRHRFQQWLNTAPESTRGDAR